MDILNRIQNIPVLAIVKYTFLDKLEVVSVNFDPLSSKLWIWEKSAGKNAIVSITFTAALKCILENDMKQTVIFCDDPIPYKTCVMCNGCNIQTLICDAKYPDRIAFIILENNIHINTAQIPENVDKLYKIQKEIESVKVVLHDAMEKLLIRGEKLEDLQERVQILGENSARFYENSKKLNRCCFIL